MTDSPHLIKLQTTLQEQIKAAHEERKKPLSSEEVAQIVRQVVRSLEGDVSAADLKFYTALEELALFIRQAKHDIASIRPKDISTEHIPVATDELDTVVGATEEATNKIMDVCDEIAAIAELCPSEVKGKLIGCTTKIFEACNFQDITGQRITKVVETLKHIDSKIEALVKAMGEEIHRGEGSGAAHKHLRSADPDSGLLNGPQLPQRATSQEDIDKLMES
jgi:chemotaxis protein CheZ